VTGVAGTEPEGLPYHRVQQGVPGRGDWWRPLVGVLSLALGMLVLAPVVVLAGFSIGYAVTGTELDTDRLLDTDRVTPAGLAYVLLVLSCAIPVAWGVSRVLHGLSPRWLSSVVPRIRWRWFTVCLGLALVALAARVVVGALLPSQGGAEVSGELNDFTRTTRDFALVVLLLTPLQAAGEEYAFRGYLTQAFGGLTRQPWVAVLVPSVLFALAHGAGQSWPIFFDRFAFGLVAGTLVILTGGLEAGIAMHVLNNWLAFSLALAFDDMSTALNPTDGSWWTIPATLTHSLVYLGLAVLVGRRMRLQTRTAPGVLEASGARV
jgi:membrane protease YdiL (CAAX protease family)